MSPQGGQTWLGDSLIDVSITSNLTSPEKGAEVQSLIGGPLDGALLRDK